MTALVLLLTLLILSVLVIVHELGHFLAARLFGVRVLEFSVGFGPLLAKTVRRNVQYSLRAVPLGGYCKMAGMDIALEGEPDQAAANDPGSLRNQPAWKKSLIVIAGPLFNLALAALTFMITFAAVGVPSRVDKRSIIGLVDPKTPGYEAGLSPGDRITAVDGRPVTLWTELEREIRGSGGKPVRLTVEREGRSFVRTVTPFYDPMLEKYRLGITPKYYYARMSIGKSVVEGIRLIYTGSVAIVQLVGRGLTGRARVPLSGPVGMIGMVGQTNKAGPGAFLEMIASLNLFLGLFNLLPIPLPLLDGGWVVIYLLEKLRRREFTPEQKAAAQLFGLLLIGTFFLFITYGDLVTGVKRFLNR